MKVCNRQATITIRRVVFSRGERRRRDVGFPLTTTEKTDGVDGQCDRRRDDVSISFHPCGVVFENVFRVQKFKQKNKRSAKKKGMRVHFGCPHHC